MPNLSFHEILVSFIYGIIAVAVCFVLFYVATEASILAFKYLTLPSTSILSTGYIESQGNAHWFMSICDHSFRILLLAVSFAAFSNLGICLFKLLPTETLKRLAQAACAVAMVSGMGWRFLFCEPPLSQMPTLDIVLALVLYSYFCYVTIPKEEEFTRLKGLFAIFKMLLAFCTCVIIMYITATITIFAKVINEMLDIWTWIDLTMGTESSLLHYILSTLSHIQNIIIYCAALGMGMLACYKLIYYLVPVKISAGFLQSAITLWGLECLLFAVTDKESMNEGVIDQLDFCVIVLLFIILSVVVLLITLSGFTTNEDS